MNKQRGYIDLPRGFFEVLAALAGLGLLALIGAIGYGLWWLWLHTTFTF